MHVGVSNSTLTWKSHKTIYYTFYNFDIKVMPLCIFDFSSVFCHICLQCFFKILSQNVVKSLINQMYKVILSYLRSVITNKIGP